MALSHFSSTKATSLASGMTSNATAVYLVDGSTYPDPAVPGNGQYSVILGYGSDREEVCTVIAKSGANQLTVTRGQDGTAAVAKNIGDVVVHGVSARDFEGNLPLEGGTLTGALTLSGAPTQNLHAATKAYVDDAVTAVAASAVPAGLIAPYGSATPPTGWILANGQSTTGYPLLIAMYGATVPDLRDKFILGDGGSLPNTGGAATVSLSSAQSGLKAHTHPGSSVAETDQHTHSIDPPNTGTSGVGDHAHGIGATTVLAPWNGVNQDADTSARSSPTRYASFAVTASGTGGAGAHSHTVDIGSFNSGGRSASHTHGITVSNNTASDAASPHENMPPYYALTFIVKAV